MVRLCLLLCPEGFAIVRKMYPAKRLHPVRNKAHLNNVNSSRVKSY